MVFSSVLWVAPKHFSFRQPWWRLWVNYSLISEFCDNVSSFNFLANALHTGFVAFNKLFLTVVFSSTLKSLEKCSVYCLGGIASTELYLSFPLRVFRCCQNCFGLFVKVFKFSILFSSHICFWILIVYLYLFG